MFSLRLAGCNLWWWIFVILSLLRLHISVTAPYVVKTCVISPFSRLFTWLNNSSSLNIILLVLCSGILTILATLCRTLFGFIHHSQAGVRVDGELSMYSRYGFIRTKEREQEISVSLLCTPFLLLNHGQFALASLRTWCCLVLNMVSAITLKFFSSRLVLS